MSTTVKYNGVEINPAPFVARNWAGVDYGNRWGVEEGFELKGNITGITGTGNVGVINEVFSRQPGTLLVTSDGQEVISGVNVFVDEISFNQSIYGKGGYVPYSVKLRSYKIPSGVMEPSNKYSFNFGEGDIVNVSHDISARGTKNDSFALLNAINFVNQFVGKTPAENCSPYFIPSGSGILISRSENINRLEGIYSVSEVYQYTTGASLSYVESSSLDVDESAVGEYKTLNLTLDYLGSQIDSDVDTLLSDISGLNPMLKLSSLYKYSTGNLIVNGQNIDINSGENRVIISASYISGLSGDTSGFFDYGIDMTWDEIEGLMSFGINGDFDSKGTLSARKKNYDDFKLTNGSDYVGYLYGLVTGSSLGKAHLTGNPLCPYPSSFGLTDNTGEFKISLNANFDNRDYLTGLPNVSYSVSADASKWLFNIIPSANIEGHFAVQDLNCRSRERTNIDIQATTSGNPQISTIDALRSDVYDAVFAEPPFLMGQSASSGEFSIETSHQYIGDENIVRLTQGKLSSSQVLKNYLRATGQRYGY